MSNSINRMVIFFLVALLTLSFSTAMAEVIKDPMRPPAFALTKYRLAKLKKNGVSQPKLGNASKPVVKALRLSSILIGNNRKVAIINDQMLVVGDKVGSARLVKILKDRVHLSRNGKKIELKLDNEITAIKKHAVESKL